MAINIKFDDKEKARLYEMTSFERDCYKNGFSVIAGVDEVGRGPLAGPVVAAAVILKEDEVIPGVNDSKKLSEKKREFLYNEIKARALSVGVGVVDEKVIDEINILNATYLAMKMAVENLTIKPDFILLDAVSLSDLNIPQKPIVKGDCLSLSIAAASIIAKVERDRMICEYDKVYPLYGFSKHKGYGTKYHMDAIRNMGILPVHRKSFLKNI